MKIETEKYFSDTSFKKSVVLILTFFVLTPVTLLTSIFSLFIVSMNVEQKTEEVLGVETVNVIDYPQAGVRVYASIADTHPTITSEPLLSDARVEIVRQYLKSFNSPIIAKSEYLVQIADKYGLDFRLLVAIAQKESNLCKIIPPGGHNCWGWGIHTEGTLGFESYEEAIETVARGLKKEYLDKGYQTVEEIMSKYTPHSPDGAWAKDVSKFMSDMK